jgi:hypothetical protein
MFLVAHFSPEMEQHHHISGKYLLSYALEITWQGESVLDRPTERCIQPLQAQQWLTRCRDL